MTVSGVFVQRSGRASRASARWPPTKVQTPSSGYVARSNVQGGCDAPPAAVARNRGMRICKLWNLALGIMAIPFRGGRLSCLSTAYVNPLTAHRKDVREIEWHSFAS